MSGGTLRFVGIWFRDCMIVLHLGYVVTIAVAVGAIVVVIMSILRRCGFCCPRAVLCPAGGRYTSQACP